MLRRVLTIAVMIQRASQNYMPSVCVFAFICMLVCILWENNITLETRDAKLRKYWKKTNGQSFKLLLKRNCAKWRTTWFEGHNCSDMSVKKMLHLLFPSNSVSNSQRCCKVIFMVSNSVSSIPSFIIASHCHYFPFSSSNTKLVSVCKSTEYFSL